MAYLTDNSIVLALGWTLLHSLWQATLLALIIRLLWQFMSQRFARWRYGLALGALALTLAAAVFTFGYYQAAYAPVLPAGEELVGGLETGAFELAEATLAAEIPLEEQISLPKSSLKDALEAYLPLLVVFWLLGTLFFGIRLAGSWWYMRRLGRKGLAPLPDFWAERFQEMASKMGISRPVRLHLSKLAEEPITLRHLKPIVLFPVGLINQLSVEQVEAILLHELAHIRRWDYLVNWLQSIVELLFFYHPAVWWISGQVREAREHCCDDLVVQKGGAQRMLYAQTLTQLTALSFTSKRKLTMSIKGINGAFSQRVKRLFGQYETGYDWRKPVLSVALGGVFLLFFLLNNPDLFAHENVIHNPTEEEWETLLQEWDLKKETGDTLPQQATFIKISDDNLRISREGAFTLYTNDDPDLGATDHIITTAASSYKFVFRKGWPLIIVDGKVWDKERKALEQLDISGMEQMQYWRKKEGSRSHFGESPDQDILMLWTNGDIKDMHSLKEPDPVNSIGLKGDAPSILVVNGKIWDTEPLKFKQKIKISAKHLQALFGKHATDKYGVVGENGVVEAWTTEDQSFSLPLEPLKMLYVVDGVVKGKSAYDVAELDGKQIEKVDVSFKGAEKYKVYDVDGLVEIRTPMGTNFDEEALTFKEEIVPGLGLKEEFFMRGIPTDAIFIIDGKKYTKAPEWLWELSMDDLATIDVRRPVAEQKNENKDVVIINLLQTTAPLKGVEIQGLEPKLQGSGKSGLRLLGDSINPPKVTLRTGPHPSMKDQEPFFIIDGKEMGRDPDQIKELDPNDIERIDVLKGKSAIELYGQDIGEHGVVVITTKKKAATVESLKGLSKKLFGVLEMKNQGERPLFVVDSLKIAPDAPLREVSKKDILPWKQFLPGSKEAKAYGEEGARGVIFLRSHDGAWPGDIPYWPQEIKGYERLPSLKNYRHLPKIKEVSEKLSKIGEAFAAVNGVLLEKTASETINFYELRGMMGIHAIGIYNDKGALIHGQPTPPEMVSKTFSLDLKNGYSVVASVYDCDNQIYLRAYFTLSSSVLFQRMQKQISDAKKGITPEALKAYCEEGKEQETDLNPKGKDPLIVVDGKKWGKGNTKLANLVPEDIESINVIKGKKAEEIYGAEGKNGVILVTTEKKKSKTKKKKTKKTLDAPPVGGEISIIPPKKELKAEAIDP